MNNTSGTSVTPRVDKPKLSVITPYSKKLHALIPLHSVPQPREFNFVKHRNVIAPEMFKINPSQTSRENMSSDTVTASSIGLVHTAKNRRPQPKGNTRNARVPSTSKSSEVKKNNRRKKKIMETMNITFDELLAMALEQNSSRPSLQSMTSGQISSELKLTHAPSTITPQRLSKRDLDILFEPLHNEYLGGRPSEAPRIIPAAVVIQNLQAPTASISIQDSAPAPTI
nr:hypothetical protein [Tanacetum cinerariifolium]